MSAREMVINVKNIASADVKNIRMDEVWKDILDYKNWHQISSMGRVKSLIRKHRFGYSRKEKILKPYPNYKGYLRVDLYKDGQRKRHQVHRLVLEVFIGLCPKGMECRHLDGNPQNNRLDNLKWGTRSENQQDRIAHGTSNKGLTYNCGENQGSHKMTEKQILEIRKLYKTKLSSGKRKYSQRQLAQMFNVTQTTIKDIVNINTWKHI